MKKIVWVGAGCWFVDSLLYFKEHRIDVTIVSIKTELPWFASNYLIFADLGFRIVKNEADEIRRICESLDRETLVIGGGYFGGDVPCLASTRAAGIEGLDILYQISKYNREFHHGAKCLRWFNGDTGFGTKEVVDYFDEKIRYVDILMFDNDLLRDFVLCNSQEARRKKIIIGYMETPLERFVYKNSGDIKKNMLVLGRCISQSNFVRSNTMNLPITFIDRKSNHRPINLAGMTADISTLYRDREFFREEGGTCAYGLSHMYDIFHNSIESFTSHRDYYWSLEGQYKKK